MQTVEEFILDHEARVDMNGNLTVYHLPKGDKGGSYEVAGINDRYHPDVARKLKDLIEAGKHGEARELALDHILKCIQPVLSLHPDERVGKFMGDLAFNRGVTGSMRIAQMAMRTAKVYDGALDGKWGPKSQAGFTAMKAEDLIPRMLIAWTWFERTFMERSESNPFWPGLVNRRIAAFQFAMG